MSIILIKFIFPAAKRWRELHTLIWSLKHWRTGEIFNCQKSQEQGDTWTSKYLKEAVIGIGLAEASVCVESPSSSIKADFDLFGES